MVIRFTRNSFHRVSTVSANDDEIKKNLTERERESKSLIHIYIVCNKNKSNNII